jgi:hypothetical protein
MDQLTRVQRKLDRLDARRKEIIKEKLQAIQSVSIICSHCKQSVNLGKWSFIQTQWYTPPYSCTAGDYWNNSKPDTCYISCPECGKENYIYNHPQKAVIVELVTKQGFQTRNIFEKVEERQDR